MRWLTFLVISYLAFGVWAHACIAQEDMERGRRSITGAVGAIAAMCLEFYPIFLVAWPVWLCFRRPNLRDPAPAAPRADRKVETQGPPPVEFTDPKVASAVAAMREALKASGRRT